MTTVTKSKTARLRELINRKDKVLAVMHAPTAMHARIMEKAGSEVAFVGTNGVVGTYTGLSDVGSMTMTECIMAGRYVARSVKFPVIIDGDTGHGGIMAVRRLIQESIDAGLAGIRIDDQPIEGKRITQSAGMEVVPLENAIVRYRAAVDMKNELDPDFVIMAQCYARDAAGGGLEDTIARLKAYKEEAGVDWVQFESPHSVEEIKQARAAVSGAFSFMSVGLPRWLNLKEHLALGVNIAWYPLMTKNVMWAALWDFLQAFNEKDLGAWDDFLESRKDRPLSQPRIRRTRRRGHREAKRTGRAVFLSRDAREVSAVIHRAGLPVRGYRARMSAFRSGKTMPTIKAKTTRLRELIHRKDKVLAVMHTPTAALARVMEEAGAEVGFVGTNSVVGGYTGLSDVGTMSMTECLLVSRWIAESVSFPVIMDGDTGHGGIMAVRRMVRECIHAGVAGVRIDDQPIEGKRRTQSGGMEVVPIEHAIARYRAAVDMKNELDPDFVVMAQCYARDATNSSLEDCLVRLKAYEKEARVDWVQLESPHSVEEIKQARAAVAGPFSFLVGKLPHFLSLREHLALGVNIAWYAFFTQHVIRAALWDFMQAFEVKELAAWEEFVASRKNRPYPSAEVGLEGEGTAKQKALEERYFPSQMLEKYREADRSSSEQPSPNFINRY